MVGRGSGLLHGRREARRQAGRGEAGLHAAGTDAWQRRGTPDGLTDTWGVVTVLARDPAPHGVHAVQDQIQGIDGRVLQRADRALLAEVVDHVAHGVGDEVPHLAHHAVRLGGLLLLRRLEIAKTLDLLLQAGRLGRLLDGVRRADGGQGARRRVPDGFHLLRFQTAGLRNDRGRRNVLQDLDGARARLHVLLERHVLRGKVFHAEHGLELDVQLVATNTLHEIFCHVRTILRGVLHILDDLVEQPTRRGLIVRRGRILQVDPIHHG
mmetsp:Transcript_41268/g.124562  ORF Transcript_41268/g.124562 Transcript_41268/m.124562 type:complete len:267 (+) Transcript_41268:1-801(+)